MKYLATLLLSFSLIACTSVAPVVEDQPLDEGVFKGMYQVDKTPFKLFYLNKGEDLTRFTAVQFKPLDLSHLEIDQRRLEMRDKKWEITEEDKQAIQAIFQQQVERAFPAEGAVKLVEQDGKNVLNVAFEFMKFAPTASQDRDGKRGMNDKVYTHSVGGMAINAKLYDSESGELVAYLADAREVGEKVNMQVNDRPNNIRNLKSEISSWLDKLKVTMGALYEQQ